MRSNRWRAARGATSLLLCGSLLAGMVPAFPRSARAADAVTPALKSVDQLKTEAKSYDEAITAIAALASATLEKSEQRKAAVATLEKHAPSLRLYGSRLALMALEDRTFMAAIAKKMSDAKVADAFAKEVAADRKAILKVDGAASLQARMTKTLETNSGKLQASATRMKAAAGKASDREELGAQVAEALAAGALATLTVSVLVAAVILASPFAIVLAPAAMAGVIGASIAAFGTVVIAAAARGIIDIVGNATSEEERDEVAECVAGADAGRDRCLGQAAEKDPILRELLSLACWAFWTEAVATCWTS